MRTEYDVVVVGAGPAGLAACTVLSRTSRLKVLLIDQQGFSRVKPCGGGLTLKAQILLNLLFPDYEEYVRNVVNKTLLVFHRRAYLIHGCNIFKTVVREELDKAFLDNVVNRLGVEFKRDKVLTVREDRDCVLAIGQGCEVSCKVLIAADGVYSRIYRTVYSRPLERLPIAIRAYGKVEKLPEDDLAVLDFRFCSKIGYGWIFPLRNKMANVGTGEFKSSGKDLLKKLQEFAETYRVESLRNVQGHALPHNIRYLTSPRGRILFVGDAAGLIDYATGEGIAYALLSGSLAALSIVKNINECSYMYTKYIASVVAEVKLSRQVTTNIVYRIDRTLDRLISQSLTAVGPVIKVLQGKSTYYESFKRFVKGAAFRKVFPELLTRLLKS